MNKTAAITAVAFASLLLSACSIDKELRKARAEGACEEWSSQAPDWNRFNTGYADIQGSRGWTVTSRRICGSDTDKPDDVVGREFTQEFINARCHFGDDCTTDLKGTMPEIKRWNGED